MAMTSEREKEIRKIAGRDGQTWRSSAVPLVALNDVIDELDELRGKVEGFKAKIEMRLKDAERLRAHSLNLGHFTDAEIQGYLGRQIEKLFLEGVDLGLFSDPLTKVPEKVEPQPSHAERMRNLGVDYSEENEAKVEAWIERNLGNPATDRGPYIKPAMGFGASGLPEGFNDPVAQHFHDDCVFYANCPACVAGHAGVFNRRKP